MRALPSCTAPTCKGRLASFPPRCLVTRRRQRASCTAVCLDHKGSSLVLHLCRLSDRRTLLASESALVNPVGSALFVRLREGPKTTGSEMLRAQQSYPPSGQGSPARPIAPPPPASSSPARFTQRASAFLSNRSSNSARSGSGWKSNGSAASSSVRSSGSGGSGGGEYARNEDPANLFVRQDRIGESESGSAPFSTGMSKGLRCIILSSDDRGCHGSRQGRLRPQGRHERQAQESHRRFNRRSARDAHS